MSSYKPAIERFTAKYRVTDPGCWEWQAGIHKGNGYAVFHVGYRQFLAHRWSYTHHVGPIPEGLQIDHLCRNRRCVNPGHLEAVTPQVNTLRGRTLPAANALKTHCPRGHEYSGHNLMLKQRPTGGTNRLCRSCWNVAQNARRARRIARQAAS